MAASSLANPAAWLFDAFGAAPASAGVSVTERTVMGLPAFNAGVRVLSTAVASLPWKVYSNVGERLEEAKGRREYYLLHDAPNGRMTSFTFRRLGMENILTRGNFYALKQYDNARRVIALWWFAPWNVRIEVGDTMEDIVYHLSLKDGGEFLVRPDDMIHVMGRTDDGVIGVSPVQEYRESLGLALAAEKHAALFFGNGARLSGVLSPKTALNEAQERRLLDSFRQAYTGAKNAQKVAILPAEMEWKQLSVTPEDAQFLQTRKFHVEEMARLLGLPPHKIADLSRSTNNNIEHQAIEFVQDSLRPHLVNWEQEFNRKLFAELAGPELFCEFNVDGLLRGDFKTRQEGLSTMRSHGIINANEWRALENLNPIPGEAGTAYLVQGANVPTEDAGKQQEPAPQPEESDSDEPEENEEDRAMARIWGGAVSEIRQWESFSEKRAAAKLAGLLGAIAGRDVSAYAAELATKIKSDDMPDFRAVMQELKNGKA